ncbi:aminoglycoside 6-adenylyltransferase, partial [Enterococcus faecium]
YFVTDVESFTLKDEWLKSFANIIMMQKPEHMELFPAEEKGYSYIILFDDYNKIELTLLPLEELGNYLNHDKLIKISLNKYGRIEQIES